MRLPCLLELPLPDCTRGSKADSKTKMKNKTAAGAEGAGSAEFQGKKIEGMGLFHPPYMFDEN